jgi:bifunctional DNA-binding transcriptional regulator/antitoxin component of YhaV-PrlF toxin-antitoxin module
MIELDRLTIPKEYRQSLALDAGAPIAVVQVGNALLLIPEQARFRQLCDRVARAFSSHGIEAADVLASLPEAREVVYARLYPGLAKRRKRRKARTSRAKRG